MTELENCSVLVVGGAGFVGGNLVRRLLGAGVATVQIVDNLLSADVVLADGTFVVASADEDAAKAQLVAQQLVDLVATTAAAQTTSKTPMRFETLSAPTLPTSPSGSSRPTLAASGGAAGLLLGAIVSWFRRRKFDQPGQA